MNETQDCIIAVTSSPGNISFNIMELPLFPQVMDPRSQLLVHETPIPCSGNIVKMETFRIADKNYVAMVVATNGSAVRDDSETYNSTYYAHEQGGREVKMHFLFVVRLPTRDKHIIRILHEGKEVTSYVLSISVTLS